MSTELGPKTGDRNPNGTQNGAADDRVDAIIERLAAIDLDDLNDGLAALEKVAEAIQAQLRVWRWLAGLAILVAFGGGYVCGALGGGS